MLSRCTLLLLTLALASCRTAGLGFADVFGDGDAEGPCAHALEAEDGSAFACDDEGALVACTGRRALTKKGGLNVCTQLDEVGFMLVCTKSPTATHFDVELLPCSACTSSEALGVVDFDIGACRLPPVIDAGPEVADAPVAPLEPEVEVEVDEALDDAGVVDAGVVEAVPSEFHPCPCEATFRCDPDLEVCVARERCPEDYACDEGDACVLDDDGEAICVEAPAPPPPATSDAGDAGELELEPT